MAKRKIKPLLVVGLVLVIGLAAGGIYAYVALYQERNQLQSDLSDAEKRSALLQRKYTEEKARVGALMRAKQSLEGSLRALQAEIKTVREEQAALEKEKAGLRAAIVEKTKHLEARIQKLLERVEAVKASREAVVARFKEKAATVKAQEQEIAGLNSDLERARFETRRTQKKLDNCTADNARLCLISEELVDKYKNKGVVGSLMVKEPFTQLEQVEMEKLVQQYSDAIEKERID